MKRVIGLNLNGRDVLVEAYESAERRRLHDPPVALTESSSRRTTHRMQRRCPEATAMRSRVERNSREKESSIPIMTIYAAARIGARVHAA
jgi:hypothetical protein